MHTIIILSLFILTVSSSLFRDDRIDVEDAQKIYNYRADQVFNTIRDNPNTTTVNFVISELKKSFCTGVMHSGWPHLLPNGGWQMFNVSWTANDAGTVFGVDAIGAMYQFLGQNIFNNDSTHDLTSVVVDMSITSTFAVVHAKIATWLNLRIDPNPAFFSLARGYYQNEFTKVNGEWCMSKFVAYTINQGTLDYNVNIHYAYPFGMVPGQ